MYLLFEGPRISTPSGEVPTEQLTIGNVVTTISADIAYFRSIEGRSATGWSEHARSNEQDRISVAAQNVVVGHQSKRLMKRLGDEHAIEWIAMKRR